MNKAQTKINLETLVYIQLHNCSCNTQFTLQITSNTIKYIYNRGTTSINSDNDGKCSTKTRKRIFKDD